jgi:hypothetical protein
MRHCGLGDGEAGLVGFKIINALYYTLYCVYYTLHYIFCII